MQYIVRDSSPVNPGGYNGSHFTVEDKIKERETI